MNKYKNTDKDIHQRIYRFVVSCFRDVIQKIPKKPETIPIIGQISSSLTSMGANDREADASGSQRDFIAKYSIVKKEANETLYWLSFIHDLVLVSPEIVEEYIRECEELFSIVSAIIISAKKQQ